MQIETATRQYRDALKKITHYDRLARQADYGGRHSAQRVNYARRQEASYIARRDEALAALQATPEGVAWLEEQQRAADAAMQRKVDRFRADNLRRLVDEYLLVSELTTQRLMTWRLYERFDRRADAREAQRLYDLAHADLESLTQSINDHDAWAAVRRRSAQLDRTSRAKWEAEQRARYADVPYADVPVEVAASDA